MALDREPVDDGDRETEAIEIRVFLEALYAKHGYDLRGYADASLRRRIHAVLARLGLKKISDLQHRALREPEVLALVTKYIAVRVSELFRDPPFYRSFRAHVLPVLRTYPLLKIWHAGCASGEEAYASAILLSDEGLYDRTQLYATDLSSEALDEAKQGVYPAERRAAFEEAYRQAGGAQDLSRYCTTAYDGVAMAESLRRNILFFQHNLVSDHAFGEMNVVFCRNVFLYFGRELRARVLQMLAQSLCPGGFLCLGQSERLTPADRNERFEQVSGDCPIYRYTAVR
jgi:chemotaxis protein methyltransferase CheR